MAALWSAAFRWGRSLYRVYHRENAVPDSEEARTFRSAHSLEAAIEFISVWGIEFPASVITHIDPLVAVTLWTRRREGILDLDVDVVALVEPLLALLVQQCRVAHEPLGLVEVGGLAGPGTNVSTLCSRCFLPDRVLSSTVVASRWRGRERRLVLGRPSRR